jgi:predicted DsbA family dithiol-disulfide isomerase
MTEPFTVPDVVDVVSDVVCPWCYIGKRQLEAMLQTLPAADRPRVRWHPFQLNPDLPTQGLDRRSYVEMKFGGPERAAQVYARVAQAGRDAGLALDFARIGRQPNTRDAHRLIGWSQAAGGEHTDALVEALFRGFFVEGRPIGERAVLAELAAAAGHDLAAARAFLDGDEGAAEVVQADQRMRELGITGVPFFVFGGRVAVPGAGGADALRSAWDQTRRDG